MIACSFLEEGGKGGRRERERERLRLILPLREELVAWWFSNMSVPSLLVPTLLLQGTPGYSGLSGTMGRS